MKTYKVIKSFLGIPKGEMFVEDDCTNTTVCVYGKTTDVAVTTRLVEIPTKNVLAYIEDGYLVEVADEDDKQPLGTQLLDEVNKWLDERLDEYKTHYEKAVIDYKNEVSPIAVAAEARTVYKNLIEEVKTFKKATNSIYEHISEYDNSTGVI